jgi:hypothetical protein
LSINKKIDKLLEEFNWLDPITYKHAMDNWDAFKSGASALGNQVVKFGDTMGELTDQAKQTANILSQTGTNLRDTWNPGEAYIPQSEITGDAGPNPLHSSIPAFNTANLAGEDDYENYYNPITKSNMNDEYSRSMVSDDMSKTPEINKAPLPPETEFQTRHSKVNELFKHVNAVPPTQPPLTNIDSETNFPTGKAYIPRSEITGDAGDNNLLSNGGNGNTAGLPSAGDYTRTPANDEINLGSQARVNQSNYLNSLIGGRR